MTERASKNNKYKPVDVAMVAPWKSIHISNRFEYIERLGFSSELLCHGTKTETNQESKKFGVFNCIAQVYKAKARVYHVHYVKSVSAIITFIMGKYPLITSTMGGDILVTEQGDTNIFLKKIIGIILKNSNLVTVKSKYNYKKITEAFGPLQNLKILAWGIDFKQFNRHPAQNTLIEIPLNHRVILQPRGLDEVYNNKILFLAVKILLEQGIKDFVLWLPKAMDSGLFDFYKHLARKLGIEKHVVFSGALDIGEMNAAYNKSQVVVSIASSDGLPMTVLESLAVGTPVVVGEIPHLKDELADDIVCWTDINPNSVARAIIDQLNEAENKAAKNKRIQFVKESYNLNHALKIYEQFIVNVMDSPRKILLLPRLNVISLTAAHVFVQLFTRLLGRKIMNWAYVRDYKSLLHSET